MLKQPKVRLNGRCVHQAKCFSVPETGVGLKEAGTLLSWLVYLPVLSQGCSSTPLPHPCSPRVTLGRCRDNLSSFPGSCVPTSLIEGKHIPMHIAMQNGNIPTVPHPHLHIQKQPQMLNMQAEITLIQAVFKNAGLTVWFRHIIIFSGKSPVGYSFFRHVFFFNSRSHEHSHGD